MTGSVKHVYRKCCHRPPVHGRKCTFPMQMQDKYIYVKIHFCLTLNYRVHFPDSVAKSSDMPHGFPQALLSLLVCLKRTRNGFHSESTVSSSLYPHPYFP